MNLEEYIWAIKHNRVAKDKFFKESPQSPIPFEEREPEAEPKAAHKFFQYRTNVKNERVVAQIVSEKQVPGKLIERKVFQMEFSSDAHWSQLCMPLRHEIRLRSLSVRPI